MSSPKNCEICEKAAHKYCCPKCFISYCSVKCYKSPTHIQCSEEFYKDCVVSEMMAMQQQKSGTLDDIPGLSDDIKRMYEMLKRMESRESNSSTISDFDITDDDLDSDDDVPAIDLANRLEGVNLDDSNAIWKRLTDSERQDFEKLVQSDNIATILPAFEPWWKYKNPLVEEVNGTCSITNEKKSEIPKLYSPIPDFSSLSSKPPAECVLYNLINVLSAYTMTVRFFNGEHFTVIDEAMNYFIMVCSNLKKNINFQGRNQAIDAIVQECEIEGLSICSDSSKLITEDVQNILDGPSQRHPSNNYILAALSDIHSLLTSAKKSLNIENLSDNNTQQKLVKDTGFSSRFVDRKIITSNSVDRSKLSACIKKIEYYLSYTKKFR